MRRLDDTIILFDWNGTIVLDADRARLALNGVLGPRGLPTLSAAEFGHRFRLPMHGLFSDLGVAEDEFIESEAEWNRAMADADPIVRPGTAEALIVLHQTGATLGVVSAASESAITSDLGTLGLPKVWQLVRGGVADKESVLRGERAIRERAIYVGDTVYDIDCAIRAGYRAVGVAGGYTSPDRLRAAGAEAVIDDLGELLDL
ncbi:HAD hydrolase-like protein [soil metagenome]